MFLQGRSTWLVLVSALLLRAGLASAQGMPSGSISGRVGFEGQALPGVSVTARSPSLQGVRATVTSVNGDYFFANLPPGQYTIRMELPGFRSHEEQIPLGASQKVTVNAAMNLPTVQSSEKVAARSEQVSTGAANAATYTSALMNELPVGRTMVSAVTLAPGVNETAPGHWVTISGSSSYENVYTVNGANVQGNLYGRPLDLFVEDAIHETTTVTSGVSAELGRFTGGVVNTLTKSGGNTFSGSFRATLNNDAWRELTPYPGDAYTPGTLPTYEATLGGPFWKDHLWFFAAFRSQATSSTGVLAPPVSTSFPRHADQQRYEGKLTLTPVQNHTLTGSYLKVDSEQTGFYFTQLPIFDMASVYDQQIPQDLLVVNYNGVLTPFLFLEGQYSQRHYTFQNSGSRYTDLINGTVLSSSDPEGYYNSPVFCAACPGADETFSNQEYFGKLNWFLSTTDLGSHSLVAGFDTFIGSHRGNTYQSGSSYFINGTSVIYQNGDLFPVIDVGSYLSYYPILNVGQPSHLKTTSVFFNDAWKLNDRFSFNLGVRYDKNDARDSRGVVTADDSRWSPRLAALWDPAGKGTFRVEAGYAVYAAAPNEVYVGAGSNFGSPALFFYDYGGPPINTDPKKPLLTRAQAIQAVFNWFGITAPGQFPTSSITPFDSSIPGVDVQIIPGGLVSPSTTEWTVGVGGSAGARFTYRVEGVYRNYKDFYTLYRNTSTGQVTETQYTGQTFDLGYVGNGGDPLTRKYYGLHTNFQWHPWDSLNIGASWTWSHTYGNSVTEPPDPHTFQTPLFTYPEYHDNAWFAPAGNLPQDQRHRVRLFGTWNIPFPRSLGHLGLGFLYRLDTGLGYCGCRTGSGSSAVQTQAYVTNPGYATPPSSVTYYYTARDAYRTPTMNALDLALNYGINVGPVEFFVQPQVINVFNGRAIVSNGPGLLGQGVNTAVNQPKNYAPFNPFTTVPVLGPAKSGANWNYGSNFGQALSPAAYQTPLTFRISMGVRF